MFIYFPFSLFGSEKYTIGVLAKRGEEKVLKRWDPTALYLSEKIDDAEFEVIPLNFDEVDQVVRNKEIDFVLVNTALYIYLASEYGISRISTLVNAAPVSEKKFSSTLFGGVMFTAANNQHIHKLQDMRGKRFVAVDTASMGGWQMAWYEFKKVGIDPLHDFGKLDFLGTHDAVVMAVLSGQADAGTVRTDTLEIMQHEGLLDIKKIKVINPREYSDFPLMVSTDLYPEWPFAKLSHTSNAIAHDVAIALMQVHHEDEVARAANIAGWTIPSDYLPAHNLMRFLKIGPYKNIDSISLKKLVEKYWHWMLLILASLLFAWGLSLYLYRIKKALALKTKEISEINATLEEKVKERTQELEYQRQFQQTVFETQKSIVTVTDGIELVYVNDAFFHFLHRYNSLESFLKEHNCFCEYFEKVDQDNYIYNGINGQNWLEYIRERPHENFRVLIRRDGKEYRFLLSWAQMNFRNEIRYVITYSDITELEEYRTKLEMKVQKALQERLSQEKILLQQTKLASMGDLMRRIAHHWRQPLTVFSMQIDQFREDYHEGSLNAKKVDQDVNEMLLQLKAISDLISRFSRIQKEDKEKVDFRLFDVIDKAKQSFLTDFSSNINIQLDIPSDIKVNGIAPDLVHVVYIILSNSNDAFLTNEIAEKKIFISANETDGTKMRLTIRDNAGGIPEDILDRIFEPYYTTKFERLGTGMNLYVAKLIIENEFDGKISINNIADGVKVEIEI